ncbi:MAG: FAD-dependent oxidoreductase [Deltaproteobacteria bacterium]|nr:FAD-dependent oxidoreductase [Deltaproteobacteria bacterium]
MKKTSVLIVGGGVAGLGAATALARQGLDSLVVEKGPSLGGAVARFCCKAAPVCARCGACRLGDLLGEVAARPGIEALTRAMPVALRAEGEGWLVDLAPQPAGSAPDDPLAPPLSRKNQVAAGAIILAVGHTPFNARHKSRFGYGRVEGVVTGLELEKALLKGGVSGQGGEPPQRVAFIQCVGSRDQALGRLYCSRVCCGYALRLARLLRHQHPGSEVTFYHMDVQDYGRAWEDELAGLRQEVEFIRAIPGEVTAGPTGPSVLYAAPGGSQVRRDYDLVVLSIGMGPPLAAGALGDMLGLSQTADGFIGAADDVVGAGRAGVFVAGSAQGPRSIGESLTHAGLAAAAAGRHLAARRGGKAHG